MAEAKRLNRAVLQGEYEKDRHFRAPVMAQGKVFVPASFSTSGGYGPKFKQFFTDLVKHSAEFNSIPAAALTHYWHRRFSVTLHNAVANNFFKHLMKVETSVQLLISATWVPLLFVCVIISVVA